MPLPCCRQTAGNPDGDLDGLAYRQRPFGQPLRERLAFEEFRDHVDLFIVRADVVEREDVGM